MARDVGGDDPRAGNLHPAAFEKELAPVAIAELDPIRVGTDGVILDFPIKTLAGSEVCSFFVGKSRNS